MYNILPKLVQTTFIKFYPFTISFSNWRDSSITYEDIFIIMAFGKSVCGAW